MGRGPLVSWCLSANHAPQRLVRQITTCTRLLLLKPPLHGHHHRLALSSRRAIVEAMSPFAFPYSRTTSVSCFSLHLCYAFHRAPLLQASSSAAGSHYCPPHAPMCRRRLELHCEPSRPPHGTAVATHRHLLLHQEVVVYVCPLWLPSVLVVAVKSFT
jgi:hypothetical protein